MSGVRVPSSPIAHGYPHQNRGATCQCVIPSRSASATRLRGMRFAPVGAILAALLLVPAFAACGVPGASPYVDIAEVRFHGGGAGPAILRPDGSTLFPADGVMFVLANNLAARMGGSVEPTTFGGQLGGATFITKDAPSTILGRLTSVLAKHRFFLLAKQAADSAPNAPIVNEYEFSILRCGVTSTLRILVPGSSNPQDARRSAAISLFDDLVRATLVSNWKAADIY